MKLERLSTPQRISAVSILVVFVAAFLPWVSIMGFGALGIEGDGVITLAMAAMGAGVLSVSSGLFGDSREAGRGSRIVLLVLGGLVALIGLLDMNGAAAIGLYLTLIAGVAWVVGAAWEISLAKQAPPAASAAGSVDDA